MPITTKGSEWEMARSAWLIWAFIPVLWPVAFFVIGVRARNRGWIRAGMGYALVTLLAVTAKEGTAAAGLLGFLALVLWLFGIAHAFAARGPYLHRLAFLEDEASRRFRAKWGIEEAPVAQGPAPVPRPAAGDAAAPPMPPLDAPPQVIPPQAQAVASPAPPLATPQPAVAAADAAPAAPQPPPAPGPTSAPLQALEQASAQAAAMMQAAANAAAQRMPGAAAPTAWPGAGAPGTGSLPPTTSRPQVDLNQASVLDLAVLPGMGMERASVAVTLRQSLGGFTSFAQFAEALKLPPETAAQLGRMVTLSVPGGSSR